MLRVSQRTVDRHVKDQVKKPRPDLAARLEREVMKRWEPQIRAKARQKAATTDGVVIDTHPRRGYIAPIGSTDQDRIGHPTVALPPQHAARLFDAQEAGATDQQLVVFSPLEHLVQHIRRGLRHIQYRSHFIDGRVAETRLTIRPT